MIHYQLQCGAGHSFDGWFRDSATFDAQAARGLVECPACGSTSVSRALMAPAVPKRRRPAALPAPAVAEAPAADAPPDTTVTVAREQMPDQVRAMLQRLRAEVEKRCDYVGEQFAEEARRIHRGETAARGIYGETTPEQAEALAEDGIEVKSIPWVPRAEG